MFNTNFLCASARNLSCVAKPCTIQAPGAAFSTTIKKTAHTTLSTDGWTLHLVHCTDTSLHPGQRKTHPILMCPGLASSGPGTFDLLSHVSTVGCLLVGSLGFRVWPAELPFSPWMQLMAGMCVQQQRPRYLRCHACCVLSCLQLPVISWCPLRRSRLNTPCHTLTPLLLCLLRALQVSICEFLAASGWDCWVIDIRGNGLADKSSRIDIEQDWNIDDYLVQVCGTAWCCVVTCCVVL
jgi:hypothetical protein